jgi:hypothetical protein
MKRTWIKSAMGSWEKLRGKKKEEEERLHVRNGQDHETVLVIFNKINHCLPL